MHRKIGPGGVILNPTNTPPALSRPDEFKTNWKQLSFSFKGRINRKDYWIYFLGTGLLYITFGAFLIYTVGEIAYYAFMIPIGFVKFFWCDNAVTVKRFHDFGRSAWYLIPLYIPLIGIVLWFMFAFSKGDPEPNKYGEPPK